MNDGLGVDVAEDDGVVVVADELLVLAEVVLGHLDQHAAGGGWGLLRAVGVAGGRASEVEQAAELVRVFDLQHAISISP